MKPEEKARQNIDELLEAVGWEVQNLRKLNLGEFLGVAVREFPLNSGPADYLLFVDRKAVGVIEAKPEGTTLSGVADQTEKYLSSLPENLPHVQEPLPFAYESTGVETFFRDLRDPAPCSRRVFAFHNPETLNEWLSQGNTLRARLTNMPVLISEGLRDCQIEAIQNLEKSFTEARPRALIQMASGGGKTYTAVNFGYRLIKFANARRVLFLVDRNNLGRQTRREFHQYVTPDDGRKFTELYNVQHLTSNTLDPVSRVCITTIQRLYSMLKGEPEFDESVEEGSMFEYAGEVTSPLQVSYNPQIPIETFDFIITDECHRSIYNLWRQVLEYFDAFIIGLTATPSKQTLGFFNQNLVMEYSHERGVADGVNVPYDVYRIKTEITERRIRKGNEFCKKITYKTMGEKPEDLIAGFRNSYNPRIAVTVDMISTGTDIRPLECLIFMRNVKSRVYFEQMKGRGTRVISPTDLNAVTSDALHKTHFVIVDAIGVCENDKTDSRPLERKRSIPFDKLIMSVAMGIRDEDTITSLAGRLARLDREINEKERKEIEGVAYGRQLKQIINNLLDAIDPDKRLEKAKETFKTETPTEEQVKKAAEELVRFACEPFNNPGLRNTIIEIKKRNEQIIDTI
jgi:type I site-specific restriction endonuclease